MACDLEQQSGEGTITGGSSGTVSLTGVTAGRLLVAVLLGGTANRTWSLADDVNGAWTLGPAVAHVGGWSAIAYCEDTGAGDTVVTATISVSTGNLRWEAYEVSGAATTGALEASDAYAETVNTDNHVCSELGIDASAGSIIFSCSRCNSTYTSGAPGTNYTDLACGGTTIEMSQYRATAGALSGEQAPWTGTGSDRQARSAMAVFKAAAAAGHPAVKRMGGVQFAHRIGGGQMSPAVRIW